MQIRITVPLTAWPCSEGRGPDCAICGEAIYDEYSTRLPGIAGHIHATTDLPCLAAATERIEQQLADA